MLRLILVFVTLVDSFEVSIQGRDENDIVVTFFGENVAVINEEEIQLFNLTKKKLIDAVIAHFGQAPNDVYVKRPTPWDLYQKYGWKDVTRTVKPISGAVISKQLKSQTLYKQTFTNSFVRNTTVSLNISKPAEEELTINWPDTIRLVNVGNISHHFEFTQIGGKDFYFSSPWGVNTEKIFTVQISTDRFESNLDPGKSILVEFRVIRVVLEIEVIYQTTLSGQVAVNYRNQLSGHHFWAVNVLDLLPHIGSQSLLTKEVIKTEFYTKSERIVKYV